MLISLNAEKAFDKIQQPFLIKVLEIIELQGIHLNINKAIFRKTTTNIILNKEYLKTFPLKSGIRQKYSLSPFLFKTGREVSSKVIRHMKQIK